LSAISTHPFPALSFDLSQLNLKPCTIEAMSHLVPGTLSEEDCREVFVYSDGTGGNDDRSPAFGFLFILANASGHQYFGGFFGHRPSDVSDVWLGGGETNQVPGNETAAAISALAWLLQSRLPAECNVVFLPDAKYVIGMSCAQYQPKKQP
jgi:hypothetical protein